MFALFYLRLLGVCVGRSGRDFARGCAMRFEPGFVKEASRVRHAFLWLGPFSWPKGECGASLAGPFWAYFSENLTNFAERGVILEQIGNEGQFALTKNADSCYLWSYGPIFGGPTWGKFGKVFCMFPLADPRQTGTIVRAGPWGFKWDPLHVCPLHVCPTRQHGDMRPISHHHF